MYVPSLEHTRLEFDSNFKRKAKYMFLISFMSLSTHGNLHKPLPGLTALLFKSEDSEQTQGYQLQKKNQAQN